MENDEIGNLFALSLRLHHINKGVELKFKLSLVQLFVLQRLRHLPAASAQALAAAIGVHASTLTQTLRRLLKKEYIFIAEDPRDSRRKLISLTRGGKNVLDSVSAPLNKILSGLGGRDKQSVERTLAYLSSFRKGLRMGEERPLVR